MSGLSWGKGAGTFCPREFVPLIFIVLPYLDGQGSSASLVTDFTPYREEYSEHLEIIQPARPERSNAQSDRTTE